MIDDPKPQTARGDLRIRLVAAILVVQAIAATFFTADAALDVSSGDWGTHIAAEVIIALRWSQGLRWAPGRCAR